MNIVNEVFYRVVKRYFVLVFVLLFSLMAWAQEPEQDSIIPGFNLGNVKLPNPSSIESKYTYDPVSDRYIYTEKIGNYNINYPVILTPKEYQELVSKQYLRSYYKEKIDAFDGKKEGTRATCKPHYGAKRFLRQGYL